MTLSFNPRGRELGGNRTLTTRDPRKVKDTPIHPKSAYACHMLGCAPHLARVLRQPNVLDLAVGNCHYAIVIAEFAILNGVVH